MHPPPSQPEPFDPSVRFAAGPVNLEGNLILPPEPRGIVLFAHGSGSSRHSPRNRFVARTLRDAGLGTFLFDLLTREEEATDLRTRQWRFDIDLLASRLAAAARWIFQRPQTAALSLGFFGASTGAAAALVAAAELGDSVRAVVSRGGRPDLAGPVLPRVRAATLFIVGGDDIPVIQLNEQALDRLPEIRKRMKIIPGATHLFEEPGALEEVARLAAEWFQKNLPAPTSNA